MNFQKIITLHGCPFLGMCPVRILSFFSVVINSKRLGWQGFRDTLGRTIIPDLC